MQKATMALLIIAVIFAVGVVSEATTPFVWVALTLFVVWVIGWPVGTGSFQDGRRHWYHW